MIKSISLLTRKPELTHEQFVKHWLEIHAPLAHAVPGLKRYVQSHIVDERTRPDIPTTDVAVDGIAELWYDDRATMERAVASPEAKRLHADGALFIGGIKTFIVEEKQIVPTGRGGLERRELQPAAPEQRPDDRDEEIETDGHDAAADADALVPVRPHQQAEGDPDPDAVEESEEAQHGSEVNAQHGSIVLGPRPNGEPRPGSGQAEIALRDLS